MNIFFLHEDPQTCAQMHCDKHVVKMIVETAQLLSTAVRSHGYEKDDVYKMTHKNHPCAIWVRDNVENYNWTFELYRHLLNEYTVRYDKVHKSAEKYSALTAGFTLLPAGKFYTPPQCMPDDCKMVDTKEAYREYYKKYKSHFAKWKTVIPYWWA